MKNLLKLLSIVVLTSGSGISIVACGDGKNSTQKQDLKTSVTALTGLNITVNTSQTYFKLNDSIISANEFKEHTLAKGYIIHYFADGNANNDLTNSNQESGIIYVQITSAMNDSYWTGTTNLLVVNINPFNLQKENLISLNSLTGLDDLVANSSYLYGDLNQNIIKANEFKTKPLQKYLIKYYDSSAPSGQSIDDKMQVGGAFYVQITAANNDSNWEGESPRIEINLKAQSGATMNLNTITKLTGLKINGDINNKFSSLNSYIANAEQFHVTNLTKYTVKYYDSLAAGNEVTNEQQKPGKVYIKIIANKDDVNWFGTSKILQLQIHFLQQIISNDLSAPSLTLATNKNGTWYNGLDNGQLYKGNGDVDNKELLVDLKTKITQWSIENDSWYAITDANKLYYGDGNKDNSTLIIDLNTIFTVPKSSTKFMVMANNKSWFVTDNNGHIYYGNGDKNNGNQIAKTTSVSTAATYNSTNDKLYLGLSDGTLLVMDKQGVSENLAHISKADNIKKILVHGDDWIITSSNIIYAGKGETPNPKLIKSFSNEINDISWTFSLSPPMWFAITNDMKMYVGDIHGMQPALEQDLPEDLISITWNASDDNSYLSSKTGKLYKIW